MSFLPPLPSKRSILVASTAALSVGLVLGGLIVHYAASPLWVVALMLIWGTATVVIILIVLRRRHVRQSR